MRPQRQTWRNHCTLEGLASSLHRTNLWGTSTLCRLAHLQISRLGAPDLTKCPGALSHKFASRVLLPFSYVILIIYLSLYTNICFFPVHTRPPSSFTKVVSHFSADNNPLPLRFVFVAANVAMPSWDIWTGCLVVVICYLWKKKVLCGKSVSALSWVSELTSIVSSESFP